MAALTTLDTTVMVWLYLGGGRKKCTVCPAIKDEREGKNEGTVQPHADAAADFPLSLFLSLPNGGGLLFPCGLHYNVEDAAATSVLSVRE